VYYTEDLMSVLVVMIEGKCEITAMDDLPNSNLPVMVEHVFYYEHLYDIGARPLKQFRYSLNSVVYLPSYFYFYFVDKPLQIVD
jgi:hypothetical protein